MARIYKIENFEFESFYSQYQEIQSKKDSVKFDNTFPYGEVREMFKEQDRIYNLVVNIVERDFPDLKIIAEKNITHDYGKRHFYFHVVKAILDWPYEGIIEVKDSYMDYCYFNDCRSIFERIDPLLNNLVLFIDKLEEQNKSTNRYRKSDEVKYFLIKDGVLIKQLSPKNALTQLNQFIAHNQSILQGRV